MASMTNTFSPEDGNAELWTQIFADGHPDLRKQQDLHAKLPRDPRCRMCFVPFEGIGGWIMRRRGKARSSRNPHYCNACDGFLDTFPGGAEVEMSVLFVDVRNSVATAEQLPPAAVAGRINAFLDTATRVITDYDGFIMAFYGDCVVAVWPPGFSGADHAEKALAAARALVAPGAMPAPDGRPIAIGVGLHAGPVQICTVKAATGLFRDVSIFGHNVNIAARLASAAGPGEALASRGVLDRVGADGGRSEYRRFDLKGITDRVEAASLSP